MKSLNYPIQFGVGYYQLTHLNLKTGLSIARSLLPDKERQLELLSHPKGDPDYVAKAVLLHADFQVKENVKKLQQLMIPDGEKRVVNMKMHNGIHYAVVDLDEFGADWAGSQQNPDELILITLITENQQTIGHLAFYNQQITFFSEYAVIISGQVNDIEALYINTLSDVLIEKPLRTVKGIRIFCRVLEMNSEQSGILLQTTSAHFLCFGQCDISEETQLLTGDCQIKTGVLIHKGYIESEHSIELMAELVELQGVIAAKGKKGITVVTLGLSAKEASHLHGSSIHLIVGSHVNHPLDSIYRTRLARLVQANLPLSNDLADLMINYLPIDHQDLIGETKLSGLISTRLLNIFVAEANVFGKIYVQGDCNVYTGGNNDKFIIKETGKIFINGRSFRYQGQLGAWIRGVQETLELEIYWKKIIVPDLILTTSECRRSQIPKKLASDVRPTFVAKQGHIEFLPVLREQESYLYKTYDKTQFECLEVEDTLRKENTPLQMVFSAEYLDVSGDFSMISAQVIFHGENIQFSAHFANVSFFGCIDLLLKSTHLNLHGAMIDTNQQGGVALIAEQDIQISDSEIAAEQITIKTDKLSFPATSENKSETTLSAASKITIKSEHNSEIAEGSKVTLISPETVLWQCENLDHRGTLDFQQLSLKAEHTVSMVFGKMHGKRLDLDSYYFLAGLSSFKIDTFSVQSVVSVIGLCYIASDYYCNTSIVNLSCALYTPSSLSLSMKSGLAFCLAAANTAISILQLVLHEPTSQVALTAARLGINAGPALFQAFQLAKDIHATTQAPQVTRGNLIKIANQTKTLLLSLGVLAYGGAGVAKQLVHIAELQNVQAAMNTWNDVLSTINNLNSVVTPLLSTLFPGKYISSFFNMDFDLSACFSSTNYSLFDIHGGINCSLMTTHSSLVNVDPNPLSLDSALVLSSETSLYSLSCGQESVLPVGAHSERTLEKTIVDTNMPTLGEYTSLSAHELTVVGTGVHEFKKSSLQVDDVFIAQGASLALTDSSLKVTHHVMQVGEAKLDHSQITAKDWKSVASSQLLGEKSQLKTDTMLITKESQLELTDSVINVSGQVENAGKAQLTHSLISVAHWQSDKDSATILEQAQFQGMIDNQGAIELIQTKVDGEMHNHDGAAMEALNSKLNLKITDDHGATTQLITTELETDQWQEAGLFAADAGSDIKGHGVNITKDAQVGSRMTNWDVELTSEVDIPVDFKGAHFSGSQSQTVDPEHATHHHHDHNHDNPKDDALKPVKFKYEDESKLSASLQADGIHYHSDNPVAIKNMDLISAMPIHVNAPNLTVSGHNTSTTSFSLTGDNHVVFNHSNTIVNGSLNVQSGGDVIFTGGQTLAGGGFKVNSKEEIIIQKGAELFAKDDIDLESKKKVISVGSKKVETHTEEQNHFLRTDKSTTTTTHFKNNQIISGSGDVNVHSDNDMLLEGTDVAGQNIILNAKADIDLNALTGTDSISKDHTNFLGLHQDKYLQTVDTASPNHLVAEKKIIFVTSGDMHNAGSELSAKESIEYILPKDGNHVTNSALILSSHTEESHAGLSFHSFAGMKLPLDAHQYVSQLPLVQGSQQLAQASTMDDKLSALIHLSTDAVNTTNSLLFAMRQGGITGGLEQLLLPNLNLTWRFGKSTMRTDHQWVGPGSIITPHISISAFEASFSNNFGISAQSSYFDVDKINSTGAYLHNSAIAEDNFAVFSLSPAALLYPSLNNIGFSHSYNKSIYDVWQGDAMHLGDLTLQADEALFDGSQWHVKTLTEDVNKLIADAEANYVMHASNHVSLFSSGSFSFGESEQFSNTAAITTPFVGENSESYSADNFSIGTFVSHGEKMTNIHTDHSEFVPIYEFKKEYSFNINGCGQDLMSGFHDISQIFSTWDFRFTRHDYVARRAPDLIVLRDDNSHLDFTAPIYHPAAGKVFVDNLNWFMGQIHPVTSDTPAKSAKINIVSKLHDIKPAIAQSKIPKENHTIDDAIKMFDPLFDPVWHRDYLQSLQPILDIDFGDTAFSPQQKAVTSLEWKKEEQTLLDLDFSNIPLQQQFYNLVSDNNHCSFPWFINVDDPIEMFDPLFDPILHRNYLQNLQPILDIDFSDTPFRVGLMPGQLLSSSAEDAQILYRGDENEPISQIFKNGITAHGENTDLLNHVWPGSNDYWKDRGLISASLSKDVAAKFPTDPPENGRSFIYEIYSTRPTINVAEELAQMLQDGDFDPEDFERCKNEQERAFTKKIFPYEIKGAWEVNIDKCKIMDVEDLPFFIEDLSADAIDEFCYKYKRTIGEEFISNPNFISPVSLERLYTTLKLVGYSFAGIGMALDGMSLYHEFQDSKASGQYDNTYREGLRISGGWLGAWEGGLVSAETGATVCMPLIPPLGEAACGFIFGLIGSAVGYYTGSTIATKTYDDSFSLDLPVKNRYLTLENVEKIFLPELKDFLIEKPETALFSKNSFPDYINFGPIVEMIGHDFENLERLNHSFQILFNSTGFKTYLSNVESTISTKKGMLDELINTVFEPFDRVLYDRSSYFFPMYRHSDSSQFLSGVLEQPDIFKMFEQTSNNIDRYAENYSSLMKYLRIFYISNLLVQNAFEIAEGESIGSLIKEDIYSTLGGIGVASIGESVCIEVANNIAHLALIKPLTFTLPILGGVAGIILGEHLAKTDQHNTMDISISLAAAEQFWQAGTLRAKLAAEFKDCILPNYWAETLSESAFGSYFYYIYDLHNRSMPMGKAFIKPLHRDLLELTQIENKSLGLQNFIKEFKKNISDENLFKYEELIDNAELPANNVHGKFFRELIDKHSDFADPYIDRLKNIGKSLFALAIVESLYELARADDKINAVGRMALSWSAAEGGSCLGALAGLELCGPFSPLCVAGLSLASGSASVLLAEKFFDPIQDDDYHRVFNFNTAISFFKPSEHLQHQEDFIRAHGIGSK